jgi:3-hydroxyisobutyrate dehydrogenase-like beta-hydroxyacid dehydrogenase
MVLVDDEVVEAVIAQCAPSLRPATPVVDHTTNLPAATRERVPRLHAQGIRYVHAPVFMSPQMCREAKGIMLVSGPQGMYEQLRPALDEMTGRVMYLGERPDLAAAYKLFGNSMLFVLTGGLSDVFALAKGSGVDPADAIKLFETFPVGNMIGGRGAQMASGNFAASFELTMARKDMRLMLETAKGLPLAVLPGIAARMDAAIEAGHGSDDMGVIAADLL